MLPLTVITGILLGSALAITVSLAVVVLLFAILVGEYPRLEAELPQLVRSAALFAGMTLLCAFSFVGLVRHRRWRWYAQATMWMGVGLTGWYYWPQ